MSLCASVLCENGQTLVLATDTIVNTGFVQSHAGIQKVVQFHRDWVALIVGESTGAALDVLELAAENLPKNFVNVRTVAVTLANAYAAERMHAAERIVLAPRGWTLLEFKRRGVSSFAKRCFREVNRQLQEFELGVMFLIAGFDRNKLGHLLTVNHPGTARRHDRMGFHVMGAGYMSAFSMLLWRGIGLQSTREEAVYHLVESMLFASQISSSSSQARIYVFRHQEPLMQLPTETIKQLEQFSYGSRNSGVPKKCKEILAAKDNHPRSLVPRRQVVERE